MTLRRTLVFSAVLALLACCPAVAAPAHPPKQSRVLTIAYTQPCVVALVVVHQFTYRGCPDEQSFLINLDERFVSLEIADDSGKPVGISFNPDAEIQPPATLYCQRASRIPIDGAFYVANPALLIGSTDCPYPPTSGTIKVTLWRS
jgi:hypothetical protein